MGDVSPSFIAVALLDVRQTSLVHQLMILFYFSKKKKNNEKINEKFLMYKIINPQYKFSLFLSIALSPIPLQSAFSYPISKAV